MKEANFFKNKIMKNKIDIQIINAFVDNDKGGNSAGVVLDADDFIK